ncbi:O-antigen ligase family protein [Lysobacter capsici]|uniref:O-antigen ligase family protein n=1 Tax=Lysobacter capsici TaxID=435897 RepID=UPI00128B708F|nr:O-antigen ligase family protein [Lysobacter capsici]
MPASPMPLPESRIHLTADAAIASVESPRLRRARRVLEIGLFCLPALLISTPWGLTPFTAFALAALLMAPDQLLRGKREIGRSLRLLLALVLAVTVVVVMSKFIFDVRWREVDNRLRLLTLPFFALMVYAYRPSRRWLWAGALAGLVGAFVVAAWQVGNGVDRALGWTDNAIMFADALIALIVLAVFCRPPGELLWTTLACAIGIGAVALSGSRGIWPGLALVLVIGLLVSAGRARKLLLSLLAVLALTVIASWWIPPLAEQTRIEELRSDVDRYMEGDAASSLGERLVLLSLAGETFAEHPVTGIGVGSFGRAVRDLPQCQPPASRPGLCRLGHAHSDLPEWAATMGVPGLLAILGVYLLPLFLFARRLRDLPDGRARSAALAGLVLVLVYVACGLTQSMFAHQLIASFYAVAVGTLYGFALREARDARAATERKSALA